MEKKIKKLKKDNEESDSEDSFYKSNKSAYKKSHT